MRRLIENERFTSELMEALLHWALEDNHIKATQFGNSLMIKVELKDRLDHEFTIEGIVSNEHYAVMAVRIYEGKTGIKKELMRTEIPETE